MRSRFLIIPLIIACCALCYWGSISAGYFTWDDPDMVLNNSDVHGLNRHNFLLYFRTSYLGLYQPITMLLYALDWKVGNGDAMPFHLASLILHTLSAIVAFRIFRVITNDLWIAASTALLFAVSPIQVESVAWIAEQKTVLSGLFYLLAMLQYLRWLNRRSYVGYLLLVLFLLLAVLSKASAASLPISLLGLLLFHVGKEGTLRNWRSLLPIAIIAVIFGLLAIGTQSAEGYLRPDRLAMPLYERALFASHALARYVVRIVLPYDLSAFYPMPTRITWQHLAFGLGGVAGAFFLLWKPGPTRIKRTGLLLMYAGPLIPVLQLIPFGEALMADRYCYLACLPVYFVMSKMIVDLSARFPRYPLIAPSSAALILFVYSVASYGRVALWGNSIAMFQDIVEKYPDSDIAQFNLANSYRTDGRLQEAKEHFMIATKLHADFPQAWVGLGSVNATLHQCREAIGNFSEAIKSAPDHPNIFMAYYQRACCYSEEGNRNLAISDLKSAIKNQPQFAPPHFLLGQELAHAGNHLHAVKEYSIAMKLGHNPTACLLNRAISNGWLGNQSDAIADLHQVVQREPKQATGWFLLGIAKIRNGANGCAELQRAALLGNPQASKALGKYCSSTGH